MDKDEGIDADPLAVGLTRPSTVLGVPFTAVVLNALASIEALVFTSNLLWTLTCIPVHGICYLITLKDPRAFEVLALWMRTSLRTLLATRWYWSASSYSALAVRARPGRYARWRARRRIHQERST